MAIEGPDEAFRCEQLLKAGPGADPDVDYRQACLVAQSMRRADLAWRQELAGQTLADLKAEVERRYIQESRRLRGHWPPTATEHRHEHAISSPWARPGLLAFAHQIISLDRN